MKDFISSLLKETVAQRELLCALQSALKDRAPTRVLPSSAEEGNGVKLK